MMRKLFLGLLFITATLMAFPKVYVEGKGVFIDTPLKSSLIVYRAPLKVAAPVDGFVMNLGNGLIINDYVRGSVFSLFGNIRIKSHSNIRGNVIAVFGKVVIENGARVRGLSFGINEKLLTAYYWFFPLILVSFILLIIPFEFFFRPNMIYIERYMKLKPLESFIYGIISLVMIFFFLLALFLTIIGNFLLPLLIPLGVLAYFISLYSLSGLVGRLIRPSFKEQLFVEKVIGLSFLTILLYIPFGVVVFALLLLLAFGSAVKNRFGVGKY